MRRLQPTRHVVAHLGLLLLAFFVAGAADDSRPSIAVADFSYVDTSGEVQNQDATHQQWLAMFLRLLRDDIAKTGNIRLADLRCSEPECAVVDGVAPDKLIETAKRTGARYLVFGGIHKMSTLVQWARLDVLDLESRKVVVDRLFTFRGDNEEAWRHAAHYVARSIDETALVK